MLATLTSPPGDPSALRSPLRGVGRQGWGVLLSQITKGQEEMFRLDTGEKLPTERVALGQGLRAGVQSPSLEVSRRVQVCIWEHSAEVNVPGLLAVGFEHLRRLFQLEQSHDGSGISPGSDALPGAAAEGCPEPPWTPGWERSRAHTGKGTCTR